MFTRSDATAHTFFAARSRRFCHALVERMPSRRTVAYSPTSSLRLKSLSSALALAGGMSIVPSLKRTFSALHGTRVPFASTMRSVVWKTPSKIATPKRWWTT